MTESDNEDERVTVEVGAADGELWIAPLGSSFDNPIAWQPLGAAKGTFYSRGGTKLVGRG